MGSVALLKLVYMKRYIKILEKLHKYFKREILYVLDGQEWALWPAPLQMQQSLGLFGIETDVEEVWEGKEVAVFRDKETEKEVGH